LSLLEKSPFATRVTANATGTIILNIALRSEGKSKNDKPLTDSASRSEAGDYFCSYGLLFFKSGINT